MLELLILTHPRFVLKRRHSQHHHHGYALFLCQEKAAWPWPGMMKRPPSHLHARARPAMPQHALNPDSRRLGLLAGMHGVSAPNSRAFSTCELRQVILKQPESS